MDVRLSAAGVDTRRWRLLLFLFLLLDEEGVEHIVVRRIMGVRPLAGSDEDEGPGSENRTFLLRGVLNSVAVKRGSWASAVSSLMPKLLRRGRRNASGKLSWPLTPATESILEEAAQCND